MLSGGAQIVLFCSADSFLFLFFCRFSFRVFCPRGLSAHCAASCVLLWFIRSRPRSVGFVSMVHLVSSIRSELLWHYSQAVHLLWFGRSMHPSHEAGLPPSPRLTGCLLRMRRGHSRLSAVIGLCRSLWRPLAAAAEGADSSASESVCLRRGNTPQGGTPGGARPVRCVGWHSWPG